MFIRRTATRRSASGEVYHTYRLVESRREGGRVRQVTLLNLGSHFDLAEDLWPSLCARLSQLLGQQESLLSVDRLEEVETIAQALFAQHLVRAPAPAESPAFVEVDVHSLGLTQPRSVGVEHVGLAALAQLEFEPLLASLGINAVTRAMILAQVVARMAAPASELTTWGWLNETSALGELRDLSLSDLSIMRLYRAADVLMRHREAIETSLFNRVQDLFGLETTVTLYDLTNTYFAGVEAGNPKARRGHSKEKRSDCPLLTLGLMLDVSGFVRRSQVFAGNAVECRTLAGILGGLSASPGALVVMDRGIATEENLAWLREHGYRYLQLVEVFRDDAGKAKPRTRVTLGRLDQLTDRLDSVISGLLKVTGRPDFLNASLPPVVFKTARALGNVWALNEMWESLGFGELRRVFRKTRHSTDIEAMIWVMVFNRLCDPDSKLGFLRWLETVAMPGIEANSITHQHLLRSMDALIDHQAEVNGIVAGLLRPLIDQDLSVVFYDMTTIRAEGHATQEGEVRRFGMAKEGLIARQFMLGIVQTGEGLPIYHEVFAGNRAESPTLLPTLKTVLERFPSIRRVGAGRRPGLARAGESRCAVRNSPGKRCAAGVRVGGTGASLQRIHRAVAPPP